MSRYCSRCGAENKNESQFCEKCGWDLNTAYQPQETPKDSNEKNASALEGNEPVPKGPKQQSDTGPISKYESSLSWPKVYALVVGVVAIICIFSIIIWRSSQSVKTPALDDVSSMVSLTAQAIASTRVSTIESIQAIDTPEATSTQSVTATEKEPVKLLEDDNIDVYYLRHSMTTVYFRVKNKTSYPLTFQCKSIAFDGESTDDLIMSENIAPNSESVAVLECRGIFPTGDVSTLSGQFRYRIENENGDIETPSFSNIEIK